MGIPGMTKKAFMSAEKQINQWWSLLEDSMKEAGAAEKAIAISREQYHHGIPPITVIVDGVGQNKHTNIAIT